MKTLKAYTFKEIVVIVGIVIGVLEVAIYPLFSKIQEYDRQAALKTMNAKISQSIKKSAAKNKCVELEEYTLRVNELDGTFVPNSRSICGSTNRSKIK